MRLEENIIVGELALEECMDLWFCPSLIKEPWVNVPANGVSCTSIFCLYLMLTVRYWVKVHRSYYWPGGQNVPSGLSFFKEFIELIYFFCDSTQKNYGLCLAQLGRNLMSNADTFCTTVYCWCVLYPWDLVCPHLFRKLILIVVLQPFCPLRNWTFTVLNCFLKEGSSGKALVAPAVAGTGVLDPSVHWSPQVLPC